MTEKAYEKHAWMIFFGLGIFLLTALAFNFLLLGSGIVDSGHWNWLTSEPAVYDYIAGTVRLMGLVALGFAIFIIATSLTGYRRGERWAWYSFWYLPVFFLAIAVLVWPWLWPVMTLFFVLSLAGLLLPYRKFFPKS